MTSIYNGQFLGNILIVGRTNCGKTTFIEKLGLNNFFGDIVKTEWVSGIVIDKKREAEIQSYFRNETEVHIAQVQDQLDSLTDTFKQRSHEKYDDNSNNVNSSSGENRKLHRLIIMDDVSGIANVSKNFSDFLTVSRKFGYNCVYVFHVIVPSSQVWQKAISQTNIFNIFHATVLLNTVSKIIRRNCILQSKKYVPPRSSS